MTMKGIMSQKTKVRETCLVLAFAVDSEMSSHVMEVP
jgi:hypothetical protein